MIAHIRFNQREGNLKMVSLYHKSDEVYSHLKSGDYLVMDCPLMLRNLDEEEMLQWAEQQIDNGIAKKV